MYCCYFSFFISCKCFCLIEPEELIRNIIDFSNCCERFPTCYSYAVIAVSWCYIPYCIPTNSVKVVLILYSVFSTT